MAADGCPWPQLRRCSSLCLLSWLLVVQTVGQCSQSVQSCVTERTAEQAFGQASSLLSVNLERRKRVILGGSVFTDAGKPTFGAKIAKTKRLMPLGGGNRGKQWQTEAEDVNITCGVSYFAPGRHRCPDECAFQSPDLQHGCYWRCVREDECGQDDPRLAYVDEKKEICRECLVLGCWKCMPDQDKCTECLAGYELVNGHCKGRFRRLWTVFFLLLGVVGVIVLLWYLGILCSDSNSQAVLDYALRQRWRSSLRDYREGLPRQYPLLTNLVRIRSGSTNPVGGPGLMLLFRFQACVLGWIIFVLLAWSITGWLLGHEVFVVGTYVVHDPQEMCQAVRWGRGVRDRARLGKFVFSVVVYVVSTAAAVTFAVFQCRCFHEVDARNSTMMDFAVFLTGFPHEQGPSVEADVSSFLQQVTGLTPLGVSVCWDYAHVERQVLRLAMKEVRRRELNRLGRSLTMEEHIPEPTNVRTSLAKRLSCICGPVFGLIDKLLGVASDESEESAQPRGEEERARDLLGNIRSSGKAFAIFATEGERDQVMEALTPQRAALYKGQFAVHAERRFYEPLAVLWVAYSVPITQVAWRVCVGVLTTLVAILIWGACFYAPYAYFEAEAYSLTGQPPGFQSELTFSLLVVVGNQIMYFLCSAIAERVGFRSKDRVQEAYVLMYTAAVLVNTIVDITIVVYTSYLSMVSRGVRTDDGVLLRDLPDRAAVFESYPMMKVFGRTLYEYNFPSCFLIPFMCEAVFTIVLPYHLGCRLVRSRNMSKHAAETCLAPIPMDLARYGDLVVNVILATLCFFTASGWIMRTYVGMLLGNAFVYAFDHYRVLRQVESFYMASGSIDARAQELLLVPCAILAGAVAYQLHGLLPPGSRIARQNIFLLIAAAFVLHVAVHAAVLHWALVHFGRAEKQPAKATYREVAVQWPANWFTCNPVHCLRSLYVHKHSPPCVYYVKGKEECLEVDETHGLFYSHRKPVRVHSACRA